MSHKHILMSLVLALILTIFVMPVAAQEQTINDVWEMIQAEDWQAAADALGELMQSEPGYDTLPYWWQMAGIQLNLGELTNYYYWVGLAQASDHRLSFRNARASAVVEAYANWAVGINQPGFDLIPSEYYGWNAVAAYTVKAFASPLEYSAYADAYQQEMLDYANSLPISNHRDYMFWIASMYAVNTYQCNSAVESTSQWREYSSSDEYLPLIDFWSDVASNMQQCA